MAKRRPVKSKKKSRRRKKKKPAVFPRIIASLVILVVLVVAAAWLVNFFLLRRPLWLHDRAQAPEKASGRPAYEVFTAKVPPPPPVIQRPSARIGHKAKVAIIIDDMGYDSDLGRRMVNLDKGITISMLPFAPFKRKILVAAREHGHEIMLHLPMEPMEYPSVKPGPGALLSSMSPDDLIEQLQRDLADVNGVAGVNNHMGSRLTSMDAQMRQIFSILKKRGLFFIDSRTTADTVCRPSAQLLKLPFAQRDVFIDHVDDSMFIRNQLKLLVKRAKRQGYAIGIAHPHPKTCEVLEEMIPKLKAEVDLVPASRVVALASAHQP